MTITVQEMQLQAFLKKLDSEGRVKAVACPSDFQVGTIAKSSKLTVVGKTHVKGSLLVTGDCYLSGSLITSSSWINVTEFATTSSCDFTEYWHNYNDTWAPASFMKDGMGFVHLQGRISASNSAASQNIFTLPTGSWPADGRDHIFTCWGYNNSGASQAACRINIYDNGRVYISSPDISDTDDWISLDGITFYAGF